MMSGTALVALVTATLVTSAHAKSPEAPSERHLRDLESPAACVRSQAARSLGSRGDRAAVPALVKALGDSEAAVRREAARALGALRASEAAPALRDLLEDPDRNVRFYAAYALGEIRDPASVPDLVEALEDPEWTVRDQAAWALRETVRPSDVERLVDALKKDAVDPAQVVWILRRVRAGARPAVERLLDAPDAMTRTRAVHALVELAGEDALEPIRRALRAERDGDARAAMEATVKTLAREKALVAHWSFDDGHTNVARDATGRGNDGQILRCRPVEGRVGSALDFSAGGFVEIGKPRGLPIANRPFTVMAWVLPRAPTGVVVARGGAFCGYSLYLHEGVPKFGIHRVEDGPAYIAAASEAAGGSWVHLAGVVREDRIELYVDGALAATEAIPGLIPSDCGQGMQIGFDAANSPAEITDALDGVIDEVKVYSEALPESRIAPQARVTR